MAPFHLAECFVSFYLETDSMFVLKKKNEMMEKLKIHTEVLNLKKKEKKTSVN